MPPCGYRPPAILGVRQFLADNLAYFIELYQPRGLTPGEAIEIELAEIARIQEGQRGGPWSASVVPANAEFYKQLRTRNVADWGDVAREGNALIVAAERELHALSHAPAAE